MIYSSYKPQPAYRNTETAVAVSSTPSSAVGHATDFSRDLEAYAALSPAQRAVHIQGRTPADRDRLKRASKARTADHRV